MLCKEVELIHDKFPAKAGRPISVYETAINDGVKDLVTDIAVHTTFSFHFTNRGKYLGDRSNARKICQFRGLLSPNTLGFYCPFEFMLNTISFEVISENVIKQSAKATWG